MPSYVYSDCNPITTGCYLYTNACLTTAASSGRYSDGTDCFTVDGTGYVTGVASCGGGSDYYHYSVTTYECSGGVCTVSGYSPAFGLIAYSSTLTVGTYYLDATSGYIFYTDSYYGYGSYGGQIITIGAVNSNCDILCSI
jgi:hypothetical protein